MTKSGAAARAYHDGTASLILDFRLQQQLWRMYLHRRCRRCCYYHYYYYYYYYYYY